MMSKHDYASYVEWQLRISLNPPLVSVAAHVDRCWEDQSIPQAVYGLPEDSRVQPLRKLKSPLNHNLKTKNEK